MKITNEQMVSILDELRPEIQQEGDVTVAMAEEEWKTSNGNARRILEKAVEDGKLIKIKGIHDTGRLGTLFRPVVK